MVAKPESFVKAETALKAALAPTIPDAEVQLGVGLPNVGVGLITQGDEDDAKRLETLRITVQSGLADTNPAQLRQTLMDAFSEIPVFEQNVQFESDEEHALALRGELEKFIAKGADIPPNFLEWIGFSDKLQRPNDHALYINKPRGTIGISLSVSGNDAQAIRDSIEADLNEIKATLANRVAKYKGIAKDDAAGMAVIKEKIDALDFTVTTYQSDITSSDPYQQLTVNITTKEQKAAMADPAKTNDGDLIEELGKANILNELTGEQLGKALGRAFLGSGKGAAERFPKIAGREDMKRAVAKSLVRLKTTKPELTEEVDAFLKDDSFKSHENYGKKQEEKPNLKSKPFVNKDPNKPGEMTIDLSLQSGKAQEIIAALAEPPQQQTAPAAEAPAVPEIPAADKPAEASASKIEKILEDGPKPLDPAAIAAAEAAKKNPPEAGAAAGAAR